MTLKSVVIFQKINVLINYVFFSSHLKYLETKYYASHGNNYKK